MAKESMKAREVKRAKLVAKYADKRAALKKNVNSGDPAEAFEAAQTLQAIPKNANTIRLHNRCKLTGRPKGYIRQFGISRIQFREKMCIRDRVRLLTVSTTALVNRVLSVHVLTLQKYLKEC